MISCAGCPYTTECMYGHYNHRTIRTCRLMDMYHRNGWHYVTGVGTNNFLLYIEKM